MRAICIALGTTCAWSEYDHDTLIAEGETVLPASPLQRVRMSVELMVRLLTTKPDVVAYRITSYPMLRHDDKKRMAVASLAMTLETLLLAQAERFGVDAKRIYVTKRELPATSNSHTRDYLSVMASKLDDLLAGGTPDSVVFDDELKEDAEPAPPEAEKIKLDDQAIRSLEPYKEPDNFIKHDLDGRPMPPELAQYNREVIYGISHETVLVDADGTPYIPRDFPEHATFLSQTYAILPVVH